MGVRAYRIEKIKTGSGSFSFGVDSGITDFLIEDGYTESLGLFSNGIIDIPVDVVKEIIDTKEMTNEAREELLKDIAWAEKKGKECISYFCQ